MTFADCSMAYRIVGRAAMIRVSSVIFPSFTGTLKSTRMNTRLPAMSTSLIVFLSITNQVITGNNK
jgi:hypothetical protein